MVTYLVSYLLQCGLWILGWTISSELFQELNRYPKLVILFPHTSWWDGPIGVGLSWGYLSHFNLFMLMLSSYFKYHVVDNVLRFLKLLPATTHTRTGTVQRMINTLQPYNTFLCMLSPEGTRKPVSLRSGFHYIAKSTGAHVMVVNFDYSTHVVRFAGVFYPTTLEEDLVKVKNLLGLYPPRYPQQTIFATHHKTPTSTVNVSRVICVLSGIMISVMWCFF